MSLATRCARGHEAEHVGDFVSILTGHLKRYRCPQCGERFLVRPIDLIEDTRKEWSQWWQS